VLAPLPFLPVCITVRLGIVVGASHELFIMHCMDGRTKTFKRLLLTIFHSYRASKNCCDKVILPRQARDKQVKDDTLRQDRLGTPQKRLFVSAPGFSHPAVRRRQAPP
jgi:hypothetical protein